MTPRVDPVAHLRELSETAARAADVLGEQILAATQMVRGLSGSPLAPSCGRS